MNTRKKLFLILLFLLVIVIVIPICINAYEEEVKINIKSKPVIDIILTKCKTKAEIKEFKKELCRELENLSIDTNYVNVIEKEMVLVENTTSFKWNEDISSSIGSIVRENNGANVTMKGNDSNEGKNAIWIMPEKNQEQKFTFSYNIDFGDSFKAAGMLLRVKEDGNKLTGYALSFNQSGYDYYSGSGNSNGALWKFTYTKSDHSTPMQKTKVAGLNINKTGSLTVVASDTQITVTGGGLSSPYVYNIPLDDSTIGNGYGFFTDHYSHGCDDIGYFQLTGINLQTEDIKSYTEVLKEPEWRENSYKFLVDVNDTQNEELQDKSRYAEILSRLLDDTIYFVSWGVSLNESQFEKLIKDNDNHGKFIVNTDDSLYKKTANYIKEVIGTAQETQYIIVGEPLDITITPDNIRTETVDAQWPYGKWKLNHDYEYYENNMGQFAQSGQYLNDFINAFDKVGKYEITYINQSIVPKAIYVHRRPIAVINMTLDGTNVSLDGGDSYDLDYKSHVNNGIVEYEWKYLCVEESIWHNEQLKTIEAGKNYVVQLRVKDEQGAWSSAETVYIGNGKPVAKFSITTTPLTNSTSNVEYVDFSYDPTGKKLTNYLWEIYKEDETTKIYSKNEPKKDFTDLEAGIYKIYLTVYNSDNRNSERFCRIIEVTEDKIAPEFIVNPIECDWTKSIDINVQFNDEGGSGFNSYKYAITESQNEPQNYSDWISENDTKIIINEMTGEKYLHIVARDNANNISKNRVMCVYKLDNILPEVEYSVDMKSENTNSAEIVIIAKDKNSGLKSIKLPNNTIVTPQKSEEFSMEVTYNVNKNGVYKFEIEDRAGNILKEEVEVKNIVEPMVTLAYYQENANDDKYTMIGTYNIKDIDDGIKISDIPNIENIIIEQFNNIKNDEKDYFEYDKEKSSKELEDVINGRETKIVNIYFNRKEYKLKFKVGKIIQKNGIEQMQIGIKNSNSDDTKWIDMFQNIKLKVNGKEYINEYECTAKYEQYIEWLYPYYLDEENSTLEYWLMGWDTDENSEYFKTHEKSNMVDIYKIMDKNLIIDANDTEKVHELYAVWTDKPIYYKYHYMCENLNQSENVASEQGKIVREYNGKYYTESRSVDLISNKITEKVNTHDDILGYKKIYSKIEIAPGNVYQGTTKDDPIDVYIYYDRLEYELVINNMVERYIPSQISQEYNNKGIYLSEVNGEKKIIVKYATDLSLIDKLKDDWINDSQNPLKYIYNTKDNEFVSFDNWYNSPDNLTEFELKNVNFLNYDKVINIYINWIIQEIN